MKVAITLTGRNPVKQENYEKWIKGNDAIEIITIASDKDVNELQHCDGLVLTGGVDVHPDYYGRSTSYDNPDSWQIDRDEYEIKAFQIALEKKIPVIGVCRGLQLINIIQEGTLIQDLGDNALNPVHRADEEKKDNVHNVVVEQETLLHKITGITEGEINSSHHQAIGKLGKGLRINARATDGTVEGIEWENPEGKSFLLAVQWHPERIDNMDSPFSKNIRERFIQEMKNKK